MGGKDGSRRRKVGKTAADGGGAERGLGVDVNPGGGGGPKKGRGGGTAGCSWEVEVLSLFVGLVSSVSVLSLNTGGASGSLGT